MADYGGAFEEYQQRTDQVEKTAQYFKAHAKELDFQNTETCLAIGPAFGTIDSQILQFCMPKCKTYYAVEPDTYSVAGLKKILQETCPNIKADIFHGPESEYPGPPERVDTIMAFHLLYHIEDRQGFLRKCVKEWLKPNGRLLIVHDPPENSFKEVAKEFPELTKGHENFRYYQKNIENDLDHLQYAYEVDTFISHCDLKNVNQKLASFYLQRNASACEVTRLSNLMSKCYPSGTEELINYVTVVKQQ